MKVKRGKKKAAFQTSSTPTKSDRPKSRRQDKVKIITTPWTGAIRVQTVRRQTGPQTTGRGGSKHGFTLGHRGHRSHQQGLGVWLFRRAQ
ncbi:hypothetical protein BJX61DRAFT_502990 [Aspergillus egyptiacus]|nr:hypothetical protein BJX61DRAFT_502990 [Aspergillus egyptiacus]